MPKSTIAIMDPSALCTADDIRMICWHQECQSCECQAQHSSTDLSSPAPTASTASTASIISIASAITSITTTTSTIRSMLPLLSSCDPLHDLCDAENELYCNPIEYKCGYLPSTTATASTATAESNVGAVDTMTTTTATKAAAIIERTSTLAPRRSSPSTTPDPSGGDDADSTRAKQILYWCVGGVLIGMVGTVAWKIGCPHIVECFKRRGVGGGHRYQNHAYEPLAMQAMDRYRDYYSPADTTNADNNAGTSDSSDQEHRMADETSNETNGSDTSLLNCNVHNERNIYSVDDSSNENTDGSDDSDDSDSDDRSLVDIRRNIFVS